MIVGNPKAGRRIAGLAIAVFVLMGIITVLVAFRKRQAPVQTPPLHPSTLVLRLDS